MSDLVDHFEKTLGPISVGWQLDADGARMPFQIARFTGGSDENSVGFATIGLSAFELVSPVSDQIIRQEFLMLVPETLDSNIAVSLLWQIGNNAVKSGRAILRGEVIGPAGPLAPGAAVTALYVTMPVYFDDEFAVYSGPDIGAVNICWLVPIADIEADFVTRRGWDALEEEFVQQDPDLTDFGRLPMQLG